MVHDIHEGPESEPACLNTRRRAQSWPLPAHRRRERKLASASPWSPRPGYRSANSSSW